MYSKSRRNARCAYNYHYFPLIFQIRRDIVWSAFRFFNMKFANYTIKQKINAENFSFVTLFQSFRRIRRNSFSKKYFFLPEVGFFWEKRNIQKFVCWCNFSHFLDNLPFKLLLFNVSSLVWKTENSPALARSLVPIETALQWKLESFGSERDVTRGSN